MHLILLFLLNYGKKMSIPTAFLMALSLWFALILYHGQRVESAMVSVDIKMFMLFLGSLLLEVHQLPNSSALKCS